MRRVRWSRSRTLFEAYEAYDRLDLNELEKKYPGLRVYSHEIVHRRIVMDGCHCYDLYLLLVPSERKEEIIEASVCN